MAGMLGRSLPVVYAALAGSREVTMALRFMLLSGCKARALHYAQLACTDCITVSL